MHWQERARDVSDVLITALSPSTVPNLKLAHAVKDILLVFERVTLGHERQLKEHAKWRELMEQRFEKEREERDALEMKLGRLEEQMRARNGMPIIEESPPDAMEDKSLMLGNADEVDAASQGGQKEKEGRALPVVSGWSKRSGILKKGTSRAKSVSDSRKSSRQSSPVLRERGSSARAPAGQKVTLSLKRALPTLPTWRKVQSSMDDRRKRQRISSERKPLPCAKCRLRKRAITMRTKGRVNEEVFDRWANKPGNCLAFMHMDEEVDSDGQSSFGETETQEPRVDDRG